MQNIIYEGKKYSILGKGAQRDGEVYLHLASTTEFVVQKNGNCPKQLCSWFPIELVAAHNIFVFYEDGEHRDVALDIALNGDFSGPVWRMIVTLDKENGNDIRFNKDWHYSADDGDFFDTTEDSLPEAVVSILEQNKQAMLDLVMSEEKT